MSIRAIYENGIFKPLEEDASRGNRGAASYLKSHGLEPSDALIAATAMHEGLTLSTTNRKHFGSIGGLEVEVPEY